MPAWSIPTAQRLQGVMKVSCTQSLSGPLQGGEGGAEPGEFGRGDSKKQKEGGSVN